MYAAAAQRHGRFDVERLVGASGGKLPAPAGDRVPVLLDEMQPVDVSGDDQRDVWAVHHAVDADGSRKQVPP